MHILHVAQQFVLSAESLKAQVANVFRSRNRVVADGVHAGLQLLKFIADGWLCLIDQGFWLFQKITSFGTAFLFKLTLGKQVNFGLVDLAYYE